MVSNVTKLTICLVFAVVVSGCVEPVEYFDAGPFDAGLTDAGLVDAGLEGDAGTWLAPLLSPADVPAAQSPDSPLFFRDVSLSLGSQLADTQSLEVRLIRDAASYEAAFGAAPAASVNLAQRPLLAAAIPDDGVTRLRVDEAVERNGEVYLTVTQARVVDACAVTLPLFPNAKAIVELPLGGVLSPSAKIHVVSRRTSISCTDVATRAADVSELLTVLHWEATNRGNFDTFPFEEGLEAFRLAGVANDAADGVAGLRRAVRELMVLNRSGHTYFETNAMPSSLYSRVGVCARPSGQGAVITAVSGTAPLAVARGEKIVGVNNLEAEALFEFGSHFAAAGFGAGSASSQRHQTVAAMLAAPPVNARFIIENVAGQRRVETLGAGVSLRSCLDPFGSQQNVEYALDRSRGDGVVVIANRQFSLIDPGGLDSQQAYELLRQRLKDVLAQVRNDPFVVIDLRGNIGGYDLASDFVSRLPGATDGVVNQIYAREGATFAVAPTDLIEVDADAGLAERLTGKVAFLVDGFSISAADITVLAAQRFSDALLVGAPSTGAFGSMQVNTTFTHSVQGTLMIDPFRAVGGDGALLENHPAPLDLEVELSPADVAQGIDTQLEAAAALLKQ